MLNGEKWFCIMAQLKRESTLKAGLLMMILSANYVKNLAMGILQNHLSILKIYSVVLLASGYTDPELTAVTCGRLEKLVQEPKMGNAWHADHIIPVYKGGGECMLENVRTLCVACHAEVTKAQQKELNELRKKAKELLRNAINQQKDDASEVTEDDDESLLVVVPGSAYSSVPQAPATPSK